MISERRKSLKPAAAWGVVLLSAALLRLSSIDFALEVERARPDEEFVAGRALRMVESGDPNPHFFHYPSFFIYVNAFFIWLLAPLREPENARLLSRLLSATAGVGTVWLAGRLGALLDREATGYLAAAFVAVSYLHVRESHFGTTDVAMTFWVTASALLAVRGRKRARCWDLCLAGLCSGLAASTKYTGILALVPVVFCVPVERQAWSRMLGIAVLVAAIAVAVVLTTSPYLLLDREGMSQSLTELTAETWGQAAPLEADLLYPVTFSLFYGLGVPLLSAGLIGLASGVRKWEGLFLLVWVLPFFTAAALTPTRFARYALPLVPPLCVAAGAVWHRLSLPRSVSRVLIATLLLPPLVRSIEFDQILGREDTRVTASRWIVRSLPPGTRIVLSSGYGAPPIPDGYQVRFVGFRRGPVVEAEREGFRYLVTHEHPVLRRFSRVDESLRHRLESAHLQAVFDPFSEGMSAGVYDALDAFYLPYAGFGGVERPGPRIAIWRLR